MNELETIWNTTGTLHHAYLMVGDEKERLLEFLSGRLGLSVSGNPDVQHLMFDTLTVDEAHKLATAEERRSFGGERKIFIIEANIITEEAQNSLLKVFEEPTPGTHFFLIMPQDILLPTLRSRLQVFNTSTFSTREKEKSIRFLNPAERLKKVKELTEDISDDHMTKQDAVVFLNTIETELYQEGLQKNASALRACESARVSLYDRGAPIKMILENLVLSL